MANSTPLNVLDPFISDDQNWQRIWTHSVFHWFIWLFERWVLLFSPLAIPMFVCWGVSTAIGVVIQYKITANNLNSGSSLLQFCNCCDRPKPDRWQDTRFFYKWRCQVKTRAGHVQYSIPLIEPYRSQYTQSLHEVLTTSSSPTCISLINPMLTRDETRALHVQRTLFMSLTWHSPRHQGDHVHQDTCLHQHESS